TWRDNTYPGAACDVPSFAYCFSFEQKTDWSRKWAPQAEILEYMEHCARKYDLLRHIRFGTEISAASWEGGASLWRISTTKGEEILAEVLVSGVGQLNRPEPRSAGNPPRTSEPGFERHPYSGTGSRRTGQHEKGRARADVSAWTA